LVDDAGVLAAVVLFNYQLVKAPDPRRRRDQPGPAGAVPAAGARPALTAARLAT
jgi:hypothetical protein